MPVAPFRDRAIGALCGVAVGDALGMPAQTLPRDAIVARYGRITDFVLPFQDHPVSHGLRAAEVTDDTEQTLLLAARLIADRGEVDPSAWAGALLAWEAGIRRRGLRDLLGPSSKAALEALLAGVPASQTPPDLEKTYAKSLCHAPTMIRSPDTCTSLPKPMAPET